MIPAHAAMPAVLAEILKKAPLTPEKVAFAWRSAVGANVAKVTEVRLLDEGVLAVSCTDQHWAREITRSSRLIVARMATLLGDGVVRRISSQGA